MAATRRSRVPCKILLSLGFILCFSGVLHARAQEYEPINTPVSASPASSASAQYANSNSRTLGGAGSYYSEPKSAQYYYPADSYSYGGSYGGNAVKRDSQPERQTDFGVTGDSGTDGDSGLYGLLGLFGLAGLIPALLPILGPIIGILAILLLPILLPIIGPILLVLAIPLLLLLAIPLALLFLPVPVVTVPAAGRTAKTSSIAGGLDIETARMIYNSISKDECIERYTCEVARMAKGFGVNTEKIYGFFLGKKQPPASPKWMHSIARGFKNNDNCKSYACTAKLF